MIGDSSVSRRLVVLVTNIPTPYRIPLFNTIQQQLAAAGHEFHVVFAATGYARRRWEIQLRDCGFDYTVLGGAKAVMLSRERAVFSYPGLMRFLASKKPAVVITGGFGAATLKAWILSLVVGLDYVVWSGAIHRKNRPDSWLLRWHRRLLVARAKGFVAYGSRAKEYLVGLGADPGRVSIGINTVDTNYFQQETARARATVGANPSGAKRILYVGNLESGKRLDLLLAAVRLLTKSRRDFVVDLVGSGSQEKQLQQLAMSLEISDYVHFWGHLQRPEVVARLAEACCFAFPSEYDVWGLVLVEAMAAGLPCLASVDAGATRDLIQDGITGFVVNFARADVVAARLDWLLSHPEQATAIGENARRWIAENCGLQRSADGFVRAIKLTTGSAA